MYFYMGAFLFFSIGVFSLPIPIKLRTGLMSLVLFGLMSLVLLATWYFFEEPLSTNNFEKLGTIGTWIKRIIETHTYVMVGVYLFFVYFMNHFVLLMVGVQIAFVTMAWSKYKNEATLKDFWKKVSQYLLLRWFLGIQVPLLTTYPELRANASVDYEKAYQAIPYVWSLDNAQFRLDLNHALLVVSIPLSIAVLAWCHKRYVTKQAEKAVLH